MSVCGPVQQKEEDNAGWLPEPSEGHAQKGDKSKSKTSVQPAEKAARTMADGLRRADGLAMAAAGHVGRRKNVSGRACVSRVVRFFVNPTKPVAKFCIFEGDIFIFLTEKITKNTRF